mmetsp:Transcript_12119/g.22685  ORF Transcript_12119/g.22685 Transcript_12119/m.22685 type:complete len:469 (+) Transcript_12119:79-1485(+)
MNSSHLLHCFHRTSGGASGGRKAQLRLLSSKINVKKTLVDSDKPPNSQAFVNTRLTPGEFDPLSDIYGKPRNPLYRPRWRNKAQIISAEDYAARPKVSFEEQFDSMHDAMVVLSWLDEEKRQDVYQMYLELTVQQDREFKTTSHEYLMRVIGEKFNLSPLRVAAIVQNCHDEEQAAKAGKMVNDKMAKYIDAKIKEHIDNAYMAYGEVNPNQFVEIPTGSAGIGSASREVVKVEDLYNVDELTKQAALREEGEAQLLIDTKIYIEDVDTGKIDSKANADCFKLMDNVHNEFQQVKEILNRKQDDGLESPLPSNRVVEGEDGSENESERRPRWKYVAQIINVREQKKVGKKSRRGAKLKRHQQKENTLVDDGQELRLATVEEVAQTSWRSESNEDELLYRGVKAAWLDRKLKGEKYVWGRVPAEVRMKSSRQEEEKEESVEEQNDEQQGDAGKNDANANGETTVTKDEK